MKYAFLLFCVALFACSDQTPSAEPGPVNSQTPHSNATETAPIGLPAQTVNGCYQMVLKNDTAKMQLQLQDSTITGSLSYHWYQKDWNDGTLKGVMRGDTIVADYIFKSEGITSIRQVRFLLQPNGLAQGQGELTEQNGKIIYRQPQALLFDTVHPFLRVDCPK